ncbi:MAG: PQQ-binding-like beta-propeller repeat protein [Acidobacteria bacterium]|nr:PQQ-binding-like beta-propeller repeat protein [Acidobacteriota bacterium]
MRTLALLLLCLAPLCAEWPQWRGPLLNGTNPEAHNVPVEWSETKNVAWRLKLPNWAAATPIVWGDTVFVTSAEEGFQGFKGSGQSGESNKDKLLLLAVDRATGAIRWRRVMGDGNRLGNKQNMASPSPVTDGEHVWTMTGNGELACWDFEGNKKWERSLEGDYGKIGLQFGYGSSPVLHEGRLYVQVLHGFLTDDPSYLVAFDAASGRPIWKVERPTDAPHESPDSYSTATLLERNGATQLIVAGGDYLTGHDLRTGKELWRVGGMNPDKATNYRTIASALVVGDMVLTPSRRRPFIAFQIGREPERMWDTDYGPDVPTPTSDGERLYIIDDKGVALCLRVADGSVVWDRQRIEPGTYSASPILADGKIYAISEDGTTSVLRAGDSFEVLAVNKLNDYTLATPAIVGDQIFIRTSQYLYCIRNGAGSGD